MHLHARTAARSFAGVQIHTLLLTQYNPKCPNRFYTKTAHYLWERAFSFSGCKAWNSLPDRFHLIECCFKKTAKKIAI